jgi:hypothetical protein
VIISSASLSFLFNSFIHYYPLLLAFLPNIV